MKKLLFLFVAVVAMSFASCGNKPAEQAPVEEVAVEEVAAEDSVAADTIAEEAAEVVEEAAPQAE